MNASKTYDDLLYGKLFLSPIVRDLLATNTMLRLRDISQGVLPEEMHSVRLPTRYHHSIGVAHLMGHVINANPQLESSRELLQSAALLHDAGNPCLSHLGEAFLKRMTGLDGESYLKKMLQKTRAEAILTDYGLDVREVVALVAGRHPLSRVLHGTIDVDNIDNVSRFWVVAGNGGVRFNGPRIASSFRYGADDSWYLLDDCLEDTVAWRRTRKDVYGLIYGEPHLVVAAMVWHAVDLAYKAGELKESFFWLSDTGALDQLEGLNPETARLVKKARAHDLYETVLAFDTTSPSGAFKMLCQDPNRRERVERAVREHADLPAGAFCCYAGSGKDDRQIDLPFVTKSGQQVYDLKPALPIYRIRGYLDPAAASQQQREEIASYLASLTGVR